MDKKPSTRQEIMVLLKKNGGLTVDDLAKSLQITPMGVRQHLTSLESDGLVHTSQVRHKVGRPSFLYRLTDAAEAEFPKDYINLVKFLLNELENSDGPRKVRELFRSYANEIKISWENKINGNDLSTRIRQLGDLLAEDGNMPELTANPDGSFCLTTHNCRISDVTKSNPDLCLHDHVIGQLLGAKVTKLECIASGGIRCRYLVSSERQLDQSKEEILIS